MTSPEFNPEQQVVVAVLRYVGTPDPEAVVRADRVTATLIGAHLGPALERLAGIVAEHLERFDPRRAT